MIKDDLGNRMKGYEEVSKHRLLRRTPVLIRVDGRAFHTFTKGAKKPFDQDVIEAMVHATEKTAQEMTGFELAYVQSDEATFLLQDYATLETQPWFDYEINKLVSITASAFTAAFNDYWQENVKGAKHLAMFDARAFNMPYDDVPNVFLWRQKDWYRNSVQMLAQAHFSQKELQGRKIPELKAMLYAKGHDWDKLGYPEMHGTFITKHKSRLYGQMKYDDIKKMMTVPGE